MLERSKSSSLMLPTNREIDFSNYEHGYPVSLYVNAYQKEGELDRTFSSITRMIVLEYVVNYIYSSEDEFKYLVRFH